MKRNDGQQDAARLPPVLRTPIGASELPKLPHQFTHAGETRILPSGSKPEPSHVLTDNSFRVRRCVARYDKDRKVKSFSCLDQFRCLAFARLTWRKICETPYL
ncbi:MAG: DUF4372 domain-containing protein [Rhodomicrobium sp.]